MGAVCMSALTPRIKLHLVDHLYGEMWWLFDAMDTVATVLQGFMLDLLLIWVYDGQLGNPQSTSFGPVHLWTGCQDFL